MSLPSEPEPVRIRRALLSASEPTALLPLARALVQQGVEIWSSSGTHRVLQAEGILTRSTEEITGIGSWFGGRVKTLHPGLFGGILAPRDAAGLAEAEKHGVRPFDLVAVLLYPFEEGLKSGTLTEPQLLELIDVGGPSLLRAAAKNHRYVVVVSETAALPDLVREIESTGGAVSAESRRRLAVATFRRTAAYDGAILAWLTLPGSGSPAPLAPYLGFAATADRLRYGENPHQRAEVCSLAAPALPDLAPWPLRPLKGDALSYNNLLDLDRALALAGEFKQPTAAVVKHATPCGVASAPTIEGAVAAALASDPVASFGCAVALNAPLTEAGVDALKGTFVDLLAGPAFPPEVRTRLEKRPKLKVIEATPPTTDQHRWEARTAAGRLLVQEADQRQLVPGDWKQVTATAASPESLCSLDFAWRVVRHARSNAIVLSKGSTTVGIGAGQTSRVGAVRVALEVAGARAKGAVLASDAFFPFADGLEMAGQAGVAAILQPGGSVRDAEVIAAADRLGVAMYVTGWRVFRH